VAERYSIVHVTPYEWDVGHPVNHYVKRVTSELAARGHRVAVIAPSSSPAFVRDSRRLIREASEGGRPLLGGPEAGAPAYGVGDLLPLGSARRGTRSVPVDVARTIEEALSLEPLDFVHVHEPFAPSASSAALRQSRSLNVATFHSPTERVISAQLARRVVELFFGRLDARIASFSATAQFLQQLYPADYRVVLPGADGAPGAQAEDGAVRIAFAHREERAALRLFLRALRRLSLGRAWTARVETSHDAAPVASLRREVRERLTIVSADGDGPGAIGADVAVFASHGAAPTPALVLEAMAAGAVPLAARLPVYEELLGDGERGLLFEPGDVETLSAQLDRLVADDELRERLHRQADALRRRLGWARVTDELEDVYASVAARRHGADRGGRTQQLRARVASRPLIDVDLHMHTDHSPDCATPVEVLLATARARGLGAIAVTDHNEISGALEARAKADGVKVIVAEEIKSAQQGEVIGLFIEEKIPRGLTLEESIAEIKRQGGLVYVPHPFDRLHSVPDYEHLLGVIGDVDAIEVFNPRVAFRPFNEEAARFAAKYRIVAGAGSDSHVPQGLGSVRIRMRDFDGPEEFLESLRDADIIRKPSSLLYVQGLKFLETRAIPASARRARRQRRVRRAVRNS
jgi:glycosyltransferase involved in cell wall biosynthesis